MTKNRAAKERKRAKRKQADRAREQQRKSEDKRAAQLFLEGVDQKTARGLAALWSVPKEIRSGAGDETPMRRARVSAPAHYATIKTLLDRSLASWHIQQFVDATHEITAYSGDAVAGMAMVCFDNDEDAVETTAMPPELLLMSPAPEKWLERELEAHSAAVVAWVVFHCDNPVVVAVDGHRQLALWFIDEEHNWHPASQVQEFLRAQTVVKHPVLQETDLGRLMALCGVEAGPEGMLASADDPCAVQAVETIRRSQDQLLRAFFFMAGQHEESSETLDYVAAENERIGKLERELAKLERRHAQAEQERDAARATLARLRTAPLEKVRSAARREVRLTDRLAAVFA